MELETIGRRAKEASYVMGRLGVSKKNGGLTMVCEELLRKDNIDSMLKANCVDIENAEKNNMKHSLIDRLRLTKERIEAMAEGIMQIVSLDDPVGKIEEIKIRPNGLQVGKRRDRKSVV